MPGISTIAGPEPCPSYANLTPSIDSTTAFLLMTLPMCIAEGFETVEPDTSRVFGHDR